MALNFDFRKTTLSVISEISSAFQNTFCFFQEPFHGRETQFSVTCKFWVHWVFFGNLNFFMSCLTPLPEWSCRTFSSGLEKESNFLSFFYVLGRQEPVWLFSWSKTNSNWAPLEKWWRTKIFIVCQTPYFLLENQFYKISHYTVNKYQGSSNFWTVWPILKIQNAK